MNSVLPVAGGGRMGLSRYSTLLLFVYGVTLLTVDKAYNVVPILLVIPALYLLSRKDLKFVPDLKILFATFLLYLTPILISIGLGYSSLSYLDRPVRSLFFLLVGALIVKVMPRQTNFFTGLALGLCVTLTMLLVQFSNGQDRPSLWAYLIPTSEVAVAVFALLIAAWGWPNGIRKWLAMLGQTCCLPIILITQTRGTFLSLLAVILFVFLFCLVQKMVRRRIVVVLTLTIVLALVLLMGQTTLGSRFDDMFSNIQNYKAGEKFTSTGIRMELWKEGLILASERPLTGYGNLGSREREQRLIADGHISPFVAEYAHFHSDYFEALATRGIPGLLSVIALYLIPISIFYRFRKSSPFLSLASMAMVISYMVSSLTDVPLKNGLTSMFFFMSIVVMTAFLNITQRPAEDSPETV